MTNTVPTDRPLSTLEYVPNIRVHYIRGNIALGGIAYIRHTGIEAVSSMGQKLLGGQNPSRKKKDRPVQGKNIPSPIFLISWRRRIRLRVGVLIIQ
jgi:hypothetical protein